MVKIEKIKQKKICTASQSSGKWRVVGQRDVYYLRVSQKAWSIALLYRIFILSTSLPMQCVTVEQMFNTFDIVTCSPQCELNIGQEAACEWISSRVWTLQGVRQFQMVTQQVLKMTFLISSQRVVFIFIHLLYYFSSFMPLFSYFSQTTKFYFSVN